MVVTNKDSNRDSGKRSPRGATARRGGPGTFSGTGFQVLAAEYDAINLIGTLLWQPHHSPHLELEPRASASGELVGYDIGLPGSRMRSEVKLNPTRADVTEFARTVARTDLDDLGTVRLQAGRGGKAVMDLTMIAQLAREAHDADRLAVVSGDLDDDQRSLLNILGRDAWQRARSIDVVVISEADLAARVVDRASSLAGPEGGQQLREHIEAVISKAARHRATINIAQVVAEMRRRGIELLAPATTDAAGVDDDVMRSVVVLQYCEVPLPLDILAQIIGVSTDVLAVKLVDYVDPRGLAADPPTAAVVGYSSPVHRPGEDALLERALEVLTAVVADRERRALGRHLLRTLRQLAIVVHERGRRPDLVAHVFPAADKVFKTAGDLHLALEVASLSLEASYHSSPGGQPPTRQMVRDRAQTLICGISWVHQRTGDLRRADIEAQESLRVGEDIGWQRNTAFCLKCIGRLRRVQAEAATDDTERDTLLKESVDYLERALNSFSTLADFGPRSDDVADCKSLLARTYRVAGETLRARALIDEALDILQDAPGSKDWADAMIVDAELLAFEHEIAAALRRLDDVIGAFSADGDTDATEIAARALATRARLLRRSHPTSSVADFERAAALYNRLEDPDRAAAMTVESWSIANGPSRELQAVILGEPPLVQVEARRLYEETIARSSSRARAQRSGATQQRLRALLDDARSNAVSIRPQW